MSFLIIFGAKYLIAVPVLAALLYLFLFRRNKRRIYILLSVIALPISYALGFIAGHLYNNPRPFVVDGTTPLVAHAADNGFPSDHTLLAATIASILFIFNRPAGIALGMLAILIGASRVGAGVHHWVDVIASIGISIISVGIASFILRYTQRAKRSS